MDGIPINTADGYGDFQEIDPSAYRMVEVYKGANALRFGANALGGAINFVTPSGRDATASLAQGAIDAGSFGFCRLQASTSGAHGETDWFLTGRPSAPKGSAIIPRERRAVLGQCRLPVLGEPRDPLLSDRGGRRPEHPGRA